MQFLQGRANHPKERSAVLFEIDQAEVAGKEPLRAVQAGIPLLPVTVSFVV